jgi:hypothetical protein
MAAPRPIPRPMGHSHQRRRSDDPLRRLHWKARRAWQAVLYVLATIGVLALATGWPWILVGAHR